jgi:hypothetical protein
MERAGVGVVTTGAGDLRAMLPKTIPISVVVGRRRASNRPSISFLFLFLIF